MEGQRLGLSALLANGRFDVLLAAALAVLSVTLGVFRGAGWTVILDVAAAVLAGLTVRWPVWAGTGLGLLLVGYLFLPETAATMGEYAPLVPILGAGMRGQRRQRAWMSGGFGAVLAALTYQDYPGSPLFLLGVLVWAVLIAVLWLIGNLFTAYRRAELDAAAYGLLQERLALARELHDTTARTLARALLAAERAVAAGEGSPALEELVAGLRQASDELRRSLNLLRASEPLAVTDRDDPLVAATETARNSLESRGFPTTVNINGDLGPIPRTTRAVLVAALGEAVANVERHGLAGQPCAINLRVDHVEADMLVMNEIAEPESAAGDGGLGLVGVAERLSPLGRQLEAEQEGSTADAHHDPASMRVAVKVFVVDDDMFVRSHLAALLPQFGDLVITGVFANGAEAIAATAADPPDVILMDITMAGMDGIEATRRIRKQTPQVQILALTSLADHTMVARMQAAGAIGYLFKDTPVRAMARAVEAAHMGLAVMSPDAMSRPPADHAGIPNLNQTETEILVLICQGLTNPQIAKRVSLAPSTVKHYVSLLMERMGVTNRTMLAIHAGPFLRSRR